MRVAEAAWAAAEGRVGRASRARDAGEAWAVKRRPVRSVPERPGGETCEVRATVGAQGGRGSRARA